MTKQEFGLLLKISLLQGELLEVLKNRTFSLLPVQDFSKPWTDQMLYDKYGLSPEEIKYIEDTIKPME